MASFLADEALKILAKSIDNEFKPSLEKEMKDKISKWVTKTAIPDAKKDITSFGKDVKKNGIEDAISKELTKGFNSIAKKSDEEFNKIKTKINKQIDSDGDGTPDVITALTSKFDDLIAGLDKDIDKNNIPDFLDSTVSGVLDTVETQVGLEAAQLQDTFSNVKGDINSALETAKKDSILAFNAAEKKGKEVKDDIDGFLSDAEKELESLLPPSPADITNKLLLFGAIIIGAVAIL